MLAVVLFAIAFVFLCTLFTDKDYCYVTPPNGSNVYEWLDEVALYIELKSSALEGEVL